MSVSVQCNEKSDERNEIPVSVIFTSSEKRYTKNKVDLTRVKNLRCSVWVYLAMFAFFLALAGFGVYIDWIDWQIVRTETLVIATISTIFATALTSLIYNVTLYFKEVQLEGAILGYESQNIQDEVDEDIYESSIKMSYKYLDQYYHQTREQAGKGFLITLCVAVGGAIIIAVGIIAMFLGKAEPAYLTTACGVITEFIASIFFYLYNRTVQSMGDYHNKLVLSQNIAIALKVSDSISLEKQDEVKAGMVKELLSNINEHINENRGTTSEKKHSV